MNNSYIKGFALICFGISLITWGMDLFSVVDPCVYCRIQRTMIGLLGLILLLPYSYYIALQFIGNVLACFGAVVASMQHFNGWSNISKGNFQWITPLYANPFLLSGIALCIIIAQAMLLNKTLGLSKVRESLSLETEQKI